MAEQYRTRRERREAERRAAEAAAAAQDSAEGSVEDTPKEEPAPAKLTVKPQTPATAPAAPATSARPVEPAPARPAQQMQDTQQTQQAPRVQNEPDPRPTEKMAPIGTVPAPAPAKPEAVPGEPEAPSAPATRAAGSSEKPEMPQFQTRAERRRYMREHGLEPAPVDADQAPQESSPAPTKPVETQQKEAHADKSPAPVVKKAPVTQAPGAQQSPEPETSETQAEKAVDAPKSQDDAPKAPEAPKAQDDAAKAPQAPKSEDWVARRQAASKPRERRAPVVKPNTQGIKVVSAPSAAPGVAEAKGDEDSADHDVKPAVNSKAAPEKSQPGQDFRRAASGPATMPIESVAISPEESQMLQADEGEEVENPPAGPMKARDITYGDGEILVGDRPSALPYIVLGVGGLVAIILIVIALIMLF